MIDLYENTTGVYVSQSVVYKIHVNNESTKVQNARLCATKKQHTFF